MGHNPKRQELLIHRGTLPEQCVRVGIVQVLPPSNVPLYWAAGARPYPRMAATNFSENSNRTQPRSGPKHRLDLVFPNACK
jgi:hypothetical protein